MSEEHYNSIVKPMLYPHQVEAVDKLGKGKILYGGVGTGKTITSLAYYVKREAPKNIYVITTAKKRDSLDWQQDAAKLGIGAERDGTLHGTLTVDSWNNITKYMDIQNSFFIFDEQRLVGSGSWVKAFYQIAKQNRWILLSATPGDVWLDYVPVFVANNLYKNQTQFKREHVVYYPRLPYPKVMRYLDERTLEKHRNMLLVEMPYFSHTKRHVEFVDVDYDVDLLKTVWKDRWNPIEDQPIADVGELFRLGRRVLAEDLSRLEFIREQLVEHPKIVIYYNFNYELDILRQLYGDEGVEVGEWNGSRKTPIPDADSWVYLVQYTAGAEGWNCQETDTMIFYSMSYSYKTFEQAQGRIDRLDTPFTDLHYYVLKTDTSLENGILDILGMKQNFNENVFAKQHGIALD